MKYDLISNWQFNEQESIWEYRCYIRALYKKLIDRLIEYYKSIDEKTNTTHLEALKQAEYSWIQPEMVWLIQTNSLRVQDIDIKTVQLLEKFLINNLSVPAPELRIHSQNHYTWKKNWIINSLDNIKNSFPIEDQNLIKLDFCTEAKTAVFQQHIIHCLELLQSICPQACAEIKTYIRECILLQGKGLRSSSVPQAFGVIYLMPQDQWSIVNYIDLLIHETAHHVLLVKSSLCKFLKNPRTYTVSPLRADKRPLMGVLHAVFVLIRVCDVLETWIEKKMPDFEIANELMQDYLKRIKLGLNTLNENADFTEYGELLFQSMLERYASWEKLIVH